MIDLIIAVSGEAGQGVQTIGDLLTKSFFRTGFSVYTDKSYHSRIRGGEYVYRIRVSRNPLFSMRERIDILASLSSQTTQYLKPYLNSDTIILADSGDDLGEMQYKKLRLKNAAIDAGNNKTIDTVIMGTILSAFQIPEEIPEQLIKEGFGGRENLIASNLRALKSGYQMGISLSIPVVERGNNENRIMINGTEGTGLGAISAGCKFLAAYPMTPGTGVMTFLARRSEKYGIVVEQAEDEIAAINMAIGASFAGGRAMVTTSGGGFALMEEGISLAGMTETPVVIVDSQRPGPATGLPTRTSQEDLYLVLKSGHGEFPRYIAAPRTPSEAFELTEKAFYLADKYQIPAFVMLSQQLTDSTATVEIPVHSVKTEERFIEPNPSEGYKRYRLTNSGVSPRIIPGMGVLVRADSDEHDEEGIITEDLEIRKAMVKKRMEKEKYLAGETDSPLVYHLEAETILLGWGDSWGAIDEIVRFTDGLGYIHYNELWPLSISSLVPVLSKRLITVEGNYSGHFAELLSSELGIKVDSIGKYDGRPITCEWLLKSLEAEAII